MQLSIDQIPEDTQVPVEVERRETLVETQSACGAALDILNELLLFDKLETGALVLHKQDVSVTELVEDSVKIFTAQAREKSIELSITNNDVTLLDPCAEGAAAAQLELHDTDEVCADKNKVVQVIRNVVSNAIKFTPASGKIQVNLKFEPLPLLSREPEEVHRGGVCCSRGRVAPCHDATCDNVAIDVSQAPNGPHSTSTFDIDNERQVSGELIIEVRDSGAGISEENQRRLFKEVVQFNPELLQNGGGSGLGMCISKGIMDMHGGSISVHSPGEGRGSVFTLRLPMTRNKRESVDNKPSMYMPAMLSALSRRSSLKSVRSAPTPPPDEYDGDMLLSPQLVNWSRKGSPRDNFSVKFSSKTVSSSDRGSSVVAITKPLRFLVVDDSKMNRKMLCRLLKNKGHECTEAEDGVQALAMLTDVMALPGLADTNTAGTMTVVQEALSGSPRLAPAYDAILMDFM